MRATWMQDLSRIISTCQKQFVRADHVKSGYLKLLDLRPILFGVSALGLTDLEVVRILREMPRDSQVRRIATHFHEPLGLGSDVQPRARPLYPLRLHPFATLTISPCVSNWSHPALLAPQGLAQYTNFKAILEEVRFSTLKQAMMELRGTKMQVRPSPSTYCE